VGVGVNRIGKHHTCEGDEKRAEELRKRIAIYEQRLAEAKDELAGAQADFDEAVKLREKAPSTDSPEYKKWQQIASDQYKKIQTLTPKIPRLQQAIDGYKKELDDLKNKPCEKVQPPAPPQPPVPPKPPARSWWLPEFWPGFPQQQTLEKTSGSPSFNWTGFYAGLNIGYGWGDNSYISSKTYDFPVELGFGYNRSPDPSGVLGGGQIGVNFQPFMALGLDPLYERFMLGVEADFQGAGLSQTSGATDYGNARAPTARGFGLITQTQGFFGTARGRVGFLVSPNLLVYGTGGLAYGDVGFSISSVNNFNFAGQSSHDFTRVGWTAGGGGEWMFSPNWSVKVEYLYTDLGAADLYHQSFNPALGKVLTTSLPNVQSNFHSVRGGLNYHFNWSPDSY
jgi:outer membrane immunogenic protein